MHESKWALVKALIKNYVLMSFLRAITGDKKKR
jgi:hypothetical protein